MKKLNEDIIQYIKDKGFTLKEVAKAKGVSLASLGRLLRRTMTDEEKQDLFFLVDNMDHIRSVIQRGQNCND